MNTKLYPFSIRKNAHNLELYRNRIWNLRDEAFEEGRYDEFNKYDEELERASRIFEEVMSYRPNQYGVIFIPGKLLAEAKEISFNADNIRTKLILNY